MSNCRVNVGDRVTTSFYPKESDLLRTVLEIYQSPLYLSGWAISTDGGEKCSQCGKSPGTPIKLLDSSWFHSAENPKT